MIDLIKIWVAFSLAFFFPVVPKLLLFEIRQEAKLPINRIFLNRRTFDIDEFEIIERKKPIAFTYYHTGDSMNSGNITSSGHTTNNFKVNSKGWYTYQGKVVLAAATTVCLYTKSGPCGKWNHVPSEIEVYNLYDTITFEINNKEYQGIILDSCGSCMSLHPTDNYKQRYDIFISNSSYSFGKLFGYSITREVSNVTLYTQ